MDIAGLIFLYLFIIAFWGCVWGAVTYSVAKSRGYTGALNFWLGFLLGLIGLVIILLRPDRSAELAYYQPVGQLNGYQGRAWFCSRCGVQNAGTNTCTACGEQYWFCSMCGTPNSYQTTACCRCGYVAATAQYVNAGGPQVQIPVQPQYQQAPVQPQMQTLEEYANYTSYNGPDELMKYKELLDRGAISQEEYEMKKKQILGL